MAHHQSSSENDLQMASGGGRLVVGSIVADGHTNLHVGDTIYHQHQPVIYQLSETPDRGPHFWVDEYPTADFTGREDCLNSMRQWFLFEDNRKPNERIRHKIVVLEGMGGCGKTQLALKFVHSVKSEYWGIFWVNASKQKIAESAYSEIASRFGKGGKLGSFAAGKQWLASKTQPWLLVLDNADEVEEDLVNIQRLIPPGNHGHVLITTRTPGLPDKFANSGRLHLRDMKPEEGIDLLLRCAYPDVSLDMKSSDRGVAGEIVSKMLYNLAKPIDAAGHYIRKRKYTLERYLEKYLPQQKQRERENRSRDPADIAVETTWEIPIGRIREKAANKKTNSWRAHQDAIDLFHCFTFLHFQGIPRRVFHDVWRSQRPIPTTDKVPDLLAPSPDSIEMLDERLEDALMILRDYAIIETVNIGDSTEEANKACYTFHPLVQSSARHKLKHYGNEEEDLRPRLLIQAMRFLAAALPVDAEDLDPRFARKLIPHVVDTISMVNEIDADRSKQKSAEQPKRRLSPNGDDLDQHDIDGSIMFSEEGASLFERLLTVYDAVGWWSESLPLYRKAMPIRRQICGSLAESTLQVERNFSHTSFLHVQLEDSIRTQLFLLMKRWRKREAWSSWISTPLSPDHIPFYTALSDLSMTLWQAQKHTTSLRMGKLAVAGFDRHFQRMKKLGQEPPRSMLAESLKARFSVGRTLFHTGNRRDAHEVLKGVVYDCKKELKLKHMQAGYSDEKDLPLHMRRPQGLDHFDTLFARSDLALNLASDLAHRKDYYKHIVKSIMKNVMEGRQRTLGEQHPYTLLGNIDYCKVLGIIGEPLEGFSIADKAIRIAAETLQGHGFALQLAYGSMVRIYAYAEMWTEAADMMAKFYKEVDMKSPNFAMVWAAYARLSFRAGRTATAEYCLRILLGHKEPDLKRGFKDATTDNILEQLAVLYKHTDQHSKLAELKERYPDVDENKPLGSMYGTFNTQFKEDDDKLKTLVDLIRFLWADADRGRVGNMIYDAIARFGDRKYGSELEREEAVEKVRKELDEEGLTQRAEQETRHLTLKSDQEPESLLTDESVGTQVQHGNDKVAQDPEQQTTVNERVHKQTEETADSPTDHHYQPQRLVETPNESEEVSRTPRTLPTNLEPGDRRMKKSASQQSLLTVH